MNNNAISHRSVMHLRDGAHFEVVYDTRDHFRLRVGTFIGSHLSMNLDVFMQPSHARELLQALSDALYVHDIMDATNNTQNKED